MVFHSSAKSRGKSALLLMGAAFTLTFAIGTSSSDGLVQSAFNDALTTRSHSQPVLAMPSKLSAQIALAQPEEFWLENNSDHHKQIKPVAWSGGHLSPGDRVTIAQNGSGNRVLEVVETSPVTLKSTRDDWGKSAPLLAVALRDVANPEAPLVRFIIAEGSGPFSLSEADHKHAHNKAL